ncbi:MAG: hypothetical protein COB04_01670 [Gammaproteobacteria bacterium]|nr:MAG: hypothetical protein COB04_01670 [Gammaproteobacteria bacterium]
MQHTQPYRLVLLYVSTRTLGATENSDSIILALGANPAGLARTLFISKTLFRRLNARISLETKDSSSLFLLTLTLIQHSEQAGD